jgi:DNA mismatch endonuclease, patch repair protein
MTDHVSKAKRSKMMAGIGSKNTRPELIVRKLLFSLGYRYRLHSKTLPGKPDLVFPSRKKAIFVHGCFWHGHRCRKGQPPKSKLKFWLPKLEQNKERDRRNILLLRYRGWASKVIWECQLKAIDKKIWGLIAFLEGN